MRIHLVSTLAAVATLAGGCAAMERAQQDWINEAVTVSPSTNLGAYQRVGVERAECHGPKKLCASVNKEQMIQTLRRQLTRACYDSVSAEEMDRYGERFSRGLRGYDVRFGGHHVSIGPGGVHVDVSGVHAGVDEAGAYASDEPMGFGSFPPDLRDVVVNELGLDGIVKTSLDIGEPTGATGFRPVSINVDLIDAHGLQSVWQGQLVMQRDAEDVPAAAIELADSVGVGVTRRANACHAAVPPAVASADHGISVVGEELQVPGSLYFELGSAKLSPRSNALLDDLAAFLLAHPEITALSIAGHTDDVGDATSNMRLSQDRAQAVASSLVARGVPAARLTATGFGDTQPRVPNDSVAHRAQNRRVEFRIVR